jgi:hypothetical protein
MAGTKYTRKPAKKVAKKNQSITQTGVKKKSTLKRAVKKTVKKLGRGAMAVGSMTPIGKAAKVYKTGKKIAKVVKKTRAKKPNPKYSKGDYAYKKKLQARSSAAKTQKAYNKAEKELDLLNPNLTMDQRAKLLGGY